MQRLDVLPMLLDKKGTRTAELVQPAKEESTRWDESFLLFPAIFSAPNTAGNSASHTEGSLQCFGKLYRVSLVMCTCYMRLDDISIERQAHLLCALG